MPFKQGMVAVGGINVRRHHLKKPPAPPTDRFNMDKIPNFQQNIRIGIVLMLAVTSCSSLGRALVCQPSGPCSIPGMSCSETAITKL